MTNYSFQKDGSLKVETLLKLEEKPLMKLHNELAKLKDQLRRRNLQIKDLKREIKKLQVIQPLEFIRSK